MSTYAMPCYLILHRMVAQEMYAPPNILHLVAGSPTTNSGRPHIPIFARDMVVMTASDTLPDRCILCFIPIIV